MGNMLKLEAYKIREEATKLAGQTGDLVQRAAVYHHMFAHSEGNHVFPLLAAHGALWGSGFFSVGLKVGRVLSLQYIMDTEIRKQQLLSVENFAEAFREINRQVCVEAYTMYHLTASHTGQAELEAYIQPDLLEALNLCHHARRTGTKLTHYEKKQLFEAFFLWEQDNIVGPGVDAAVSLLDWPIAKFVALKPTIGFRYFNLFDRFFFSNFANKVERIEKGLSAFDIGARVGWDHVDSTIRHYHIMPDEFIKDSKLYFEKLYHQAHHNQLLKP